MQTFTHPDSLPFTFALCLMALLVLVQVAALLGVGFIPGTGDAPEIGVDGALGGLLDWMAIGKVPLMVTIIMLLWLFGAGGIILQMVAVRTTGFFVPATVASPMLLVASLAALHWILPPLARIMPNVETSAIDEDYVGRTAVITVGKATVRKPAEARTTDRFGRTRYIHVISDNDGEAFTAGSTVLIVEKKGHLHTVITPPTGADLIARS